MHCNNDVSNIRCAVSMQIKIFSERAGRHFLLKGLVKLFFFQKTIMPRDSKMDQMYSFQILVIWLLGYCYMLLSFGHEKSQIGYARMRSCSNPLWNCQLCQDFAFLSKQCNQLGKFAVKCFL